MLHKEICNLKEVIDENIDALLPKIEKLRDVVEETCEIRIKAYMNKVK